MGTFECLGDNVLGEKREPTKREQFIKDKAVKKEREVLEMADKTSDMDTLKSNLWDDFMGSTRSQTAYKKIMRKYREANPALMAELGKDLPFTDSIQLTIDSSKISSGGYSVG
jgi:hypothetical protein